VDTAEGVSVRVSVAIFELARNFEQRNVDEGVKDEGGWGRAKYFLTDVGWRERARERESERARERGGGGGGFIEREWSLAPLLLPGAMLPEFSEAPTTTFKPGPYVVLTLAALI
jgi:hypothetical protein